MSVNANESISKDIIPYFILSKRLPECDEIKITDYKISPVKRHHYTAWVELAALSGKIPVYKYIQVFNVPLDIEIENEDVRSFLYTMLETIAMGPSTPKGTVDEKLKTKNEEFKRMVKNRTENFEGFMTGVANVRKTEW